MGLLNDKQVGNRLKNFRVGTTLSVRRFALKAGIDQSQYAKIEKGELPITENLLEKLYETYQVDKEYMKHGMSVLQESRQTYLQTRQALKNNKAVDIPVFTGNTRAGTIEVYSDDPSVNTPVGHLPAEIFPGCNHAEKISGDSMHPLVINQGYVIGKIVDKKGIIYGEKYIVHTKYGLAVVKYLQEAGKRGFVKLVSYNKNVVPQEIPYDDITFCCRIYFIVNPS